jgi:hypothetical protein
MKEPKIVLLIFVSGKVVLTGAHGVTPCRGCGRGIWGWVVAELLCAAIACMGHIPLSRS